MKVMKSISVELLVSQSKFSGYEELLASSVA